MLFTSSQGLEKTAPKTVARSSPNTDKLGPLWHHLWLHEYCYCTWKCRCWKQIAYVNAFYASQQPSGGWCKRAVPPTRYQRHLGGSKIEWRRQTGLGTRLVNTMITPVVPGVFDHLLEELVLCVCHLRVLLHTRSVYLRDLPPAHFNFNNDIHATTMTSQKASPC